MKRRLHQDAPAPVSWWSRTFRLAAPLVVAALLGFVFGPDAFRHGVDPTAASSTQTGALQSAEAEVMRPMNPPRSLALDSSRSLPNVQSAATPQPVSTGSLNRQAVPPSRVQQIQEEAARIRMQIEELRRQQSEAMPRIRWMTEDGVEIEVELAEFMLMLERGAAVAVEAGAMQGVMPSVPGTTSARTADAPVNGPEPPRW